MKIVRHGQSKLLILAALMALASVSSFVWWGYHISRVFSLCLAANAGQDVDCSQGAFLVLGVFFAFVSALLFIVTFVRWARQKSLKGRSGRVT